VLLNIIYVAGIVLMGGSVIFFGFGHFNQNAEYMNPDANSGIVGAIVTVVFGFIRRMRRPADTQEKTENTQDGR